MNYFIEGFLLQASLILALGAQNIFVLESGLKRKRHFLVASICSICDALLIAIGVLGAASLFIQIPVLKISFGFVGVLFLAYYGFKKIMYSFSNKKSPPTEDQSTNDIKKVILLSSGFSLLNPHVYLDTIVLIGGYSAKFSELETRFQFGAGASSFSIIWFFSLALFASKLSHLLKRPKAMRYVSLVSGIVLVTLGFKLGHDVFGWLK